MRIRKVFSRIPKARRSRSSERGTAIIIAVMVMSLLAIFVAATISRTTNETLMMTNDQANTEAYFAAQASLEHMSRNFSNVFDVRIAPTAGDITRIRNDVPPGFPAGTTFDQVLEKEFPLAQPQQTTVDVGSPFAGLIALREPWRISTTVVSPSGAEVRLTRTLNNYTIPIFQFGIFYDDPMEHHPGPPFAFGGRVHTNGDIYLMSGVDSDCKFRDRVTAAGEVVVQVARNGRLSGVPNITGGGWPKPVRVNDGTGNYVDVTQGSVNLGPDIAHTNPDVPDGSLNSGWLAFSGSFRGNLTARAPRLQLPLQLGNNSPIEIIRRGLTSDTQILRDSRYANKPCLRISLSNRQLDLPGGTGGVQLNAVVQPNAANTIGGGAQGYWPSARIGGPPRAAKVNGIRLTSVANRQVWIKVETVVTDSATLVPVATDVTEDILSLGMTDRTPVVLGSAAAFGSSNPMAFGDTDAIIKIQRFAISGSPLEVNNAAYFTADTEDNVPNYLPRVVDNFVPGFTAALRPARDATARAVYNFIPGTALVPAGPSANVGYNVVTSDSAYLESREAQFEFPYAPTAGIRLTRPTPGTGVLAAATVKLIPFPIMMFDTREGLYNDSLADKGNPSWQSLYHTGADSQRVPVNGVMGLIDFDVANFRRLVNGAFNGTMPNGLNGSTLPGYDSTGWIVYISDRRNDLPDAVTGLPDGQYDGENVYVNAAADTTGVYQIGEDVNRNGVMDQTLDNTGTGLGETATYATSREASIAAVTDTPWFRRASRLINGTVLPGNLTRGFSFACEQGVYIFGNYNATGVSAGPTAAGPTRFDQYINASGTMVPSSVVADGVSILSRTWDDGKSFRWAFEFGTATLDGRLPTETTVRTALLMGDALSFDRGDGPTQGGGDEHMSGGVHNFKRFREDWGYSNPDIRMNYCGSLINLFNSVSQTGPFKCCNQVYTPPTRNWVFDSNFLNADQLPPGTPYFQYVNLTGFRRSYVQDN